MELKGILQHPSLPERAQLMKGCQTHPQRFTCLLWQEHSEGSLGKGKGIRLFILPGACLAGGSRDPSALTFCSSQGTVSRFDQGALIFHPFPISPVPPLRNWGESQTVLCQNFQGRLSWSNRQNSTLGHTYSNQTPNRNQTFPSQVLYRALPEPVSPVHSVFSEQTVKGFSCGLLSRLSKQPEFKQAASLQELPGQDLQQEIMCTVQL